MKVIILGAGISGLSLAWYLSKFCDVLVLEKEAHAGGWLKTDSTSGFLFEKGPRTFRMKPEDPLLELIKDLQLEDELITSSSHSKKRYLWQENQLQPIQMKRSLLSALMKEWRVPSLEKEETIAEFATRRFNHYIAETFFDPMTLGIYAGDIHSLSLSASFPTLKAWEKKYGSLSKGFLYNLSFKKSPLFSFKRGINSLTEALGAQIGDKLQTSQNVRALHFSKTQVEVETDKARFVADLVVSALPPYALAELLKDQTISAALKALKMQTIQVVHLGYRQHLLKQQGFGYLIPSKEKESLLGTVFDSNIFPQQNQHPEETRLTVMAKDNVNALEEALLGVKKHLGITQFPDHAHVINAKEAIPQYELGHAEKIQQIKKQIAEKFPQLHIIGNYISGVSVSDCIATAKSFMFTSRN